MSRSPTESYQLKSEMKLPPGRRQKPECSCFSSAMVSGRKPSTLSAGISETAPMWKLPVPVPVISSAAVVGVASGSKANGNVLYVARRRGKR